MFTKHDTFETLRETLISIGKDISILYVEDIFMIREEFTLFLERFFSTVDTATNGEEGLKKALNRHYDLIISDIEMPKLNGLEMIEQIKEHILDQAVLMISSHQESTMLHRSVELGVDGYLFKPINPLQTLKQLIKIVYQINQKKENSDYKHHLEQLIETKNNELLHTYRVDRITKLYTLGQFEHDILSTSDLSLVLFKINDFKSLNDFYGYEVGNSILCQCADFLREMTSGLNDANLYRISGTHFALLSPMDSYDLERFARLTIHMFEEREIRVDTELMYLEMTIGIVDRKDGISLSNGDKALREAQHTGKVIVYSHDEDKEKLHSNKLKCKDDIKRGLKEGRFYPYYQPIIDNATGKIIKYEALARLILPDGEVITPINFLPISKETKTYPQISRMIIQKAMKDFENSECFISMNLSIDDIKHPQTKDFLFKQIEAFPQPERLVFELLESEGIDSYDELGDFFSRLKSYGCKIAIDDFGSGYSNFDHLAKLNIDYIKIDGSLIINIDKDFVSQTIVEMVTSFAKKLNLKTVAEFVGNRSVESMIVSMGVSESQGYLFGAAIPYNPSMRFIQSL
ncbi:MAG: EAL domain-containing protein [Sulfuricurvum sp.]|uniref:EAL domain-containing protein n=1 Tax=Sulfuricurvum sp. TaxID=2025608 RepID=UPI0025FAAC69|nr:EAL domain-containing protein [Sulfuricurvum sp.]MBV5321132.1 EAL domain-containing protein [Sulfuricurvum sp.]